MNYSSNDPDRSAVCGMKCDYILPLEWASNLIRRVAGSASEWCSWLWHDEMTPSEQHGARAAAADLRYFLQLLDCECSVKTDCDGSAESEDDKNSAALHTGDRQRAPSAYNLVTREAFDECLRRCRRHACRKISAGPGKVEIDSAEAAAARVMALLAAMHVLGMQGPAALRCETLRRLCRACSAAVCPVAGPSLRQPSSAWFV